MVDGDARFVGLYCPCRRVVYADFAQSMRIDDLLVMYMVEIAKLKAIEDVIGVERRSVARQVLTLWE